MFLQDGGGGGNGSGRNGYLSMCVETDYLDSLPGSSIYKLNVVEKIDVRSLHVHDTVVRTEWV